MQGHSLFRAVAEGACSVRMSTDTRPCRPSVKAGGERAAGNAPVIELSANLRFSSATRAMCSSMLPAVSRRNTRTSRVWPMRWQRAWACGRRECLGCAVVYHVERCFVPALTWKNYNTAHTNQAHEPTDCVKRLAGPPNCTRTCRSSCGFQSVSYRTMVSAACKTGYQVQKQLGIGIGGTDAGLPGAVAADVYLQPGVCTAAACSQLTLAGAHVIRKALLVAVDAPLRLSVTCRFSPTPPALRLSRNTKVDESVKGWQAQAAGGVETPVLVSLVVHSMLSREADQHDHACKCSVKYDSR